METTEFDIGNLMTKLEKVNPKLSLVHEVFLAVKEAVPKGIPDALRMFFTLYIEKSMIKAEEEGDEVPYSRESAISAASSVFEVEAEIAAKFFDQVEEEARARAEGKVSWTDPEDEGGDYDEERGPSDRDVRKSRRLVRTGEAKKKFEKDGPAANVTVKQPALDSEEKPDKCTKDLGDDQTLEPVDFKKRVSKTKQDTMTVVPNDNKNQLYDGLMDSIEGKDLTPNLCELNTANFYTKDVIKGMTDEKLEDLKDVTSGKSEEEWKNVAAMTTAELDGREDKVDEAKMGVDYVKSVKTSIKVAVAALKSKDYEAAAVALDDVADDAGDASRAAKKMKRADDAKKDKKVKEARMGVDYVKSAKSAIKVAVAALKDKDYEAAAAALEDVEDDAKDGAKAARKMKKAADAKGKEVEAETNEAKDDEKSTDGTIKKSDTDADKWNAKAMKRRTRESLYICNSCAKTFRADESKCPKCLGEDVENITTTGNIIDKGLMSEDEVQKLLTDDEVIIDEDENESDICPSCGHGHMRCKKVSQESECDSCGTLDKREQLAKVKKTTNEEFGREEEESTRNIVARGIADQRDAENIARDKKGTVVVDDTDEKKFMVITRPE